MVWHLYTVKIHLLCYSEWIQSPYGGICMQWMWSFTNHHEEYSDILAPTAEMLQYFAYNNFYDIYDIP